MEKNMSKVIVEDTPIMSYKVVQNDEGEYVVGVVLHGQTVNEWTLGMNEEVAQSKARTIIDTYVRGLEQVQQQVREIFAQEEDKATKEQEVPTVSQSKD